jgi:hypothetical protein
MGISFEIGIAGFSFTGPALFFSSDVRRAQAGAPGSGRTA